MPAPDPFVLLATAADPAMADLCASLLRSAGIESRLRGESLGPYRLTIGEMAATQVWVPAGRLGDARSLVLEGDHPGLEAPRAEPGRGPGDDSATRWIRLVALAGALVFAAALWLALARLL